MRFLANANDSWFIIEVHFVTFYFGKFDLNGGETVFFGNKHFKIQKGIKQNHIQLKIENQQNKGKSYIHFCLKLDLDMKPGT